TNTRINLPQITKFSEVVQMDDVNIHPYREDGPKAPLDIRNTGEPADSFHDLKDGEKSKKPQPNDLTINLK
ncbi:MAG: hypothetical protein ACPL3C_09385, partial [Pyrobaculum sp.]